MNPPDNWLGSQGLCFFSAHFQSTSLKLTRLNHLSQFQNFLTHFWYYDFRASMNFFFGSVITAQRLGQAVPAGQIEDVAHVKVHRAGASLWWVGGGGRVHGEPAQQEEVPSPPCNRLFPVNSPWVAVELHLNTQNSIPFAGVPVTGWPMVADHQPVKSWCTS